MVRQLVGLDVGSEVYFAEDPRLPGLLVVIPLQQLPNWVGSKDVTRPRSGAAARNRARRLG
jgi:hypothetical protein